MRDVLNHVFQYLYFVALLYEASEPHADFALARRRDLVVMNFHTEAHFFQGQAHLRANILQGVDRRYGEVATLDPRAVTGVAVLVFLARVPGPLLGIDPVERAVHVAAIANVVKNEKLVLRAEERLVGDPGGLEVSLGALGCHPRTTAIALHCGGLIDVTPDDDRRVFHERIEDSRRSVGHEHHVGFLDALPTGNRGTVKHLAVFEEAGIDGMGRHREVLFFATRIGETQIDEFGLFLLEESQGISRRGHVGSLQFWRNGMATGGWVLDGGQQRRPILLQQPCQKRAMGKTL